jgi:indolepyruvate ferredoxin oxidoreductase beta subunit
MTISADPLNLIICGVGGQGNILMSGLVGSALTKKGLHVSVGETFGAAQRGGAVFSSVRISPTKAYGPLIPEGKAHFILGLEPLETMRLLRKYGNPETMCITNTYPVPPVGVLSRKDEYPDQEQLRQAIGSLCKSVWFVDATGIALKLGATIATNIVMVGALIAAEQIPLTKKEIEDEMRETFPSNRMDLNLRALEKGFSAIRSQN